MTDPNHIADARKKVSRPQIREVFMRNGARIEPDRDDLPDWVYESVFELLDSVIQQAGPAIQYVGPAIQQAGPAVQGEPVAITDADILAIAGRVESCPVSPWWLKGGVAIGDVRAAVLRFARALLVAAPQPPLQLPDFATDPDDSDEVASLWDHGYKRGWNACLKAVAKAMQPDEQQPAPDAVEIDPKDLIVQPWSSRVRSQWDYSLECGVKITHVPSGITVTCDTERSTHANKNKALCKLQSQLAVNPAPDVAGLVEVLETALFGTPLDDVPNRDNDDIWCICYPHLPERASDALRDHLARIETALAAHRKGGKQ